MEQPDIRKAVDGLVAAALDAGGRDNVTAVLVEAVA
jgi:serine/threonine protein phosphatase PrpC